MRLTKPRGPWSEWVIARLQEPTGRPAPDPPKVTISTGALDSEDLHLALFLCYELHFGGLEDVDERWEWEPRLLDFRAQLEGPFEDALRAAVADAPVPKAVTIDARLREVLRQDDGPRLSSFLEGRGTVEHYREFLIHRSAYQLREADPHTFGIPRIQEAAKAALVEIQADEYGGGDVSRMHSHLFARSMRSLGLRATPGDYLHRLPGSTLAWVNLMSLFGLHRRLRGALIGHLAAFEMTSCIPNRRYGNGLRRLGFGADATGYFDEHVEADAVHESIAANDLAGSLIAAEPQLEDDVVFGARALLVSEAALARVLLGSWERGRSSLRRESVAAAA